MPVYQCKNGPVTVMFGYDRFTFANNQIVNTKFPQIINHSSFELVTDEKVIKRAPPVHLINPIPRQTVMMTNEEIINELKSYGVNPNPYDLTDKLAYQLDILRQLEKRSYITVIDDDGNPMWYEDYKKLEAKLNERARIADPVNTPEVKVSKDEDPVEKKDEYKLATTDKIKKEGGSIGAVEYNDDYDLADEGNVDELIKAKIQEQFLAPVDKEQDDKEYMFEEEDIVIEDDDITIDNFKHIVDVPKLCINEVTEEEKETIRKVNFRNLGLIQCVLFLKNKGIFITEFENIKNATDKIWFFRTKVREYIDSHPNKEECYIELNMLKKRIDEIDKIAPSNIRKFTKRGLKRRITLLNKYDVGGSYRDDMTIQEMRSYMVKVLTVAKLGMELPKDEEVLRDVLLKYGLTEMAKDIL